jgi:hypothetical protein
LNSERYFAPAIFFFSLLLFFPALGARDLWAPVEPRYAEIVRVMYSDASGSCPPSTERSIPTSRFSAGAAIGAALRV